MIFADSFYRPWLSRDRLSLKVYHLLAISSGLIDKPKDIGFLRNFNVVDGQSMRYDPFVFDMFGYLDDNPVFDFPKVTSNDFIGLSLKRAREIGNCTVAWSGGVDSTFLLACFVHEGIEPDLAVVPYRTVGGCKEKIYFHPKLRKFVESRFKCRYISQPELKVAREFGNSFLAYFPDSCSDIPLVTGAWADALFFPNQRLSGDMFWSFRKIKNGSSERQVFYKKNKFVPFDDYLEQAKRDDGSKLFSAAEIDVLFKYAVLFGKPMDSRNRIARFLYFISAMPAFLVDSALMYMPKICSFFCTQDFIDLAYSRYWDFPNDSARYPRDKSVEKDFIRKVFGNDFGVESNW